jgi:hypothetical protein
MALYTERSHAQLTIATDCTVSFSAHNNNTFAGLAKRRAAEVHFIAAQKFLSEVTGLSARNVDHGVCVTKLLSIDRCKYL